MKSIANYNAIETIHSIKLYSQVLHEIGAVFFSTSEKQCKSLKEEEKENRFEQFEAIKEVAEKLKQNAEKILDALKS